MDFVPVLETKNPGDIAIIRSLLDSENIQYFIDGENFSNVHAYSLPMKVRVHTSQLEEARNILSDFING